MPAALPNPYFHEAATVLEDPLSTTYPDADHSLDERRFVTIGLSAARRVLVVAHAERSGALRIISARRATPRDASSIKKTSSRAVDDLRPEYDFSSLEGGVRGKYVRRFQAATNLVRLEPDLAAAFPSDEAVNEALRTVVRASRALKRARPLDRRTRPAQAAKPRR